MEKKAVPVHIYAGEDQGFCIDLLRIFPGKRLLVTKTDGTSETLEITDVNTSFTDNPMTGSKELAINVSFVTPTET